MIGVFYTSASIEIAEPPAFHPLTGSIIPFFCAIGDFLRHARVRTALVSHVLPRRPEQPTPTTQHHAFCSVFCVVPSASIQQLHRIFEACIECGPLGLSEDLGFSDPVLLSDGRQRQLDARLVEMGLPLFAAATEFFTFMKEYYWSATQENGDGSEPLASFCVFVCVLCVCVGRGGVVWCCGVVRCGGVVWFGLFFVVVAFSFGWLFLIFFFWCFACSLE